MSSFNLAGSRHVGLHDVYVDLLTQRTKSWQLRNYKSQNIFWATQTELEWRLVWQNWSQEVKQSLTSSRLTERYTTSCGVRVPTLNQCWMSDDGPAPGTECFMLLTLKSIRSRKWLHYISATSRLTGTPTVTSPSCTGGWQGSTKTCWTQVVLAHTWVDVRSVTTWLFLWSQDVQSYRQEVNGDPERTLLLLTDTRWSKQNPKYSFLSYHATTRTKHNMHPTWGGGGWGGHAPVSNQHCGCTRGGAKRPKTLIGWVGPPLREWVTLPCLIFWGKHSVLPHAAQQQIKTNIQTR